MNAHRPTATRRGFLRGCGIALALPWLESLAGRAHAADPLAGSAKAPTRLAVFFTGDGVNTKHWFPTVDGNGLKLSKTLAPLEKIKDQLLVFKGLANPNAYQNSADGHYPRMNVLSGERVNRSTTEIKLGTTMDQVAAQQIGQSTAMSCLVLGTEPPRQGIENGFAQLVGGHISWSSPISPVPKEIRPRLAFDRLFDGGEGLRRDRSLLDTLRSDATALASAVSAADRRRLDAYVSSIRELEQRIQRAEQGDSQPAAGWKPSSTAAGLPRPEPGIPANFGEHQQLMADLIVAAFRADRTRVATLMLTNDLCTTNMSFIPGVATANHEASHHSNDGVRLGMYQLINQWHMGVLARALEQMRAIDEGGGTLLDHSMVLYCSSLMDGNSHDGKELPILLAGGGGGTLPKGNRLLDFSKHPDRKLCRLHLALLQRMEVTIDRFGDADGPLDLG